MGQTLRHWRTDRLLSIRELATAADITPKTLTDIEYGRRRPTYETMRSICQVLNVDAHDIVEFQAALNAREQIRPPRQPDGPGSSFDSTPAPTVS
ncbi:MAG: helix-turn-helix transcriptional regulator [Thermomicrobiales bacterium]|nr:helix-turn-helix transcriptional regulator [Thermomicrobiales bacterium]